MRHVEPISLAQDQSASDGRAWIAWLRTFFLVAFSTLLTLYIGVVLIDPFSTGFFTPIKRTDVATNNHLLSLVGRAADPEFNAAVIGNSHAMAFEPDDLNTITGRKFVQLGDFGLQPAEQYAVARMFVRRHRSLAPALIVVLDTLSCSEQPRVSRLAGDFPLFLFEDSRVAYLRNIFIEEAIKTAAARLLILAGLGRQKDRLDGYNPPPDEPATSARRAASIAALVRPQAGPPTTMEIPALASLRTLIGELDAESPLVLYFSAVPVAALPVAGSPAAAWLDSCKARYRELVAGRANTAVLDDMVENEFSTNTANFYDTSHIRNDQAPGRARAIVRSLPALAVR